MTLMPDLTSHSLSGIDTNLWQVLLFIHEGKEIDTNPSQISLLIESGMRMTLISNLTCHSRVNESDSNLASHSVGSENATDLR